MSTLSPEERKRTYEQGKAKAATEATASLQNKEGHRGRVGHGVIHIQTMHLLEAVTAGLKLDDAEQSHLADCPECKNASTMFAQLFASVSVGLKAFTSVPHDEAVLAQQASSKDTSPLRVHDRVYLIDSLFGDSPVRFGVIRRIHRTEEGWRCVVAFDDNTDREFFGFELARAPDSHPNN